MADNVFNENEDYLIAARDAIRQKAQMGEELNQLRLQHKKLGKGIASEEKSISDEIASTIKKRRQEIEDTYDDRLDDNRARKRKVAVKRGKKKSERVNARIEDETKHISRDTREINAELKLLFKKNRVPGMCASRLYYIMFMPKGVDEMLLFVLSNLIYFLGIPSVFMLIIKNAVLDKKQNINMAFWCMLVLAVFIIVQLIIYFVVSNSTKNRHRDVIVQGRSLHDKIKANKRQADAIKESINKDKDETSYNLGAFDEKLASLDEEADAIEKEKQEAIRVFEDETTRLITDEINGRRLQVLEDMNKERAQLEDKIAQREKDYSDKVLEITNQYAAYIGEDMCKEERLSDLISIMEEGQAETVSEAISAYRGQKSSK